MTSDRRPMALSRRAVLASGGAALATSLAGCAAISSPDDCQPAEFPEGTATPGEPPEPCQYSAELETRGLDVDSTMGMGGGVSMMYYRVPEQHISQIKTVAATFVPYRRMVKPDMQLTFTALTSNEDRHGYGYITREWAERRASGDMTETEYHTRVRGTYERV